MTRFSRGQTAVLGLVLLIGVVAISSIGILLVAGQTTAEFQQQSETDRVESAFVELSQQMAEASTKSDVSKAMDLAAGEQGAVAKKDTGWITIESEDLEKDSLNLSIGTIEYVGDDGTRIAYQAGGVWRETGNETRMVSAPPIHYNRASETFTFPVVTVSGEQTLGSGDVGISHNRTGTFENATVVEDSSIDITIKSEYYRGWQQYFERQTGDASIRDVDHDEQTLKVRLGHIDMEEAFDSGLVVSDGISGGGNPDIDDDDYRSGSLPEMDSIIEDMVEVFEADNESENLGTVDGSDSPLTAGTYFADEVVLTEDLTVDLEDGNVTLVVDGNVEANEADLVVENWETETGTNHTLKIYSSGHLDVSSQKMCVDPCGEDVDAEALQVYGTSDMHVSIGTGDTLFEGIIYAARDDPFEGENDVHSNNCGAQVCMHSSIEFHGSVIASSVHFQGGLGSVDFNHDPKLEEVLPDIEPDGYSLPPQLTYLNVAHHEVDVENG